MKLRPYQTDAVNAVINFTKRSLEPCLIRAATGSGKSIIVAEIARQLFELSGKQTLVLVPSKELVEQNYEKFITLTKQRASIFSASAGTKCTKHNVVFATTGTVANEVKKARHKFRNNFAAVIIDEAHLTSRSMRSIIDSMKLTNPNLRIIGMTATPFRLLDGFIYKNYLQDGVIYPVPEGKYYTGKDTSRHPLFEVLVYSATERELTEAGYLTPLEIGKHSVESYKAEELKVQSNGKFKADEVQKTFENQRITKLIIDEVIKISQSRMSTIIFASSVKHAEEILSYLPKKQSAMVSADTPKSVREEIVERSKNGELKYLVNMQALTTGFDSTSIDTVALLRATESVGLLHQMIGRGLRLHDGKKECLLLDYAKNIERHAPNGDIYDPIIESPMGSSNKTMHKFKCPKCRMINEFSIKKDFEDYKYDEFGYIITPDGQHVINPDTDKPIAVHHGQRCQNTDMKKGKIVRCDHYWNSKKCSKCGHENSMQSRNCRVCNNELIDPNDKLHLEASTATSTGWNKGHCSTASIMSANNLGTCRIEYTVEVEGKKPVKVFQFANPNHNNMFFKSKSQKALMDVYRQSALRGRMTVRDFYDYCMREDRPIFKVPFNIPLIWRLKNGYHEIKY